MEGGIIERGVGKMEGGLTERGVGGMEGGLTEREGEMNETEASSIEEGVDILKARREKEIFPGVEGVNSSVWRCGSKKSG